MLRQHYGPLVAIAAALLMIAPASALDDGLARTPPMGWSSWYAFAAEINETKIIQIADKIVEHGLRDAGYEYINLDDGWMDPMRDRFGNLQGDRTRFPSGIKWLADQIHRRGLKLGLYGCAGVRTCMGFPGQFEHEYQDAKWLADQGIDWWKHDNCWQKWATIGTYNPTGPMSYPGSEAATASFMKENEYGLNIRGLSSEGQDAHPIDFANISQGLKIASPDALPFGGNIGGAGSPRGKQIQYYEAYRLFGEALQSTGRNITYSICPYIAGCDESVWSYYKDYSHLSMNQCVQKDNDDSFGSLLYHLDDNNAFPERATVAGPGYWNDLDMLMVGYKQLKEWESRQTLQEYRSQMSLFAVLASPLLFSADIRGTQNGTYVGHNGVHHSTFNGWTDELETILLNKEVIAVNQDPLGQQGVLKKGNASEPVQLYARELEGGALAVAVFNRGDENVTSLRVNWSAVGLPAGTKVSAVRDLWAKASMSGVTADGVVLKFLEKHDTALLRLEIA